MGHSATCIYLGQNPAVADEAGNNVVVNAGTIRADNNAIEVFGANNQEINTGLITSTTTAVTTSRVSAHSFIQNSGTIASTLNFSIVMGGTFDALTNTGTLFSAQADGIHLNGQSEQVTNAGLIEAAGRVVQINAAFSDLHNQGSMVSKSGDGLVYFGGQNARIANFGSITASGSGIVDASGTTLWLNNKGSIIGQTGAGVNADASLTADGSHIVNSGTISGQTFALHLGLGVDSVNNTCILEGDVFLGGGNDMIDTRFGIVTGFIAGGDGSDTYLIGDANVDLVENNGVPGDIDTVKSTVSYQLSDSFEVLYLLGGHALNGAGNTAANTLFGNSGDNRLSGLGGNDTLAGRMGDDSLFGGPGNDQLVGGDGDDALTGGSGRDTMIGGNGADAFIFLVAANTGTTVVTADVISDFQQGDALIDLSQIDANRNSAGKNDTFTFIGTASFTAGTAGQVHYLVSGTNTLVEFDTNGDTVADGAIKLMGLLTLSGADFVL